MADPKFNMVYHIYNSDGSHDMTSSEKLDRESEINLAKAYASNGTKTVAKNDDGTYSLKSAVNFSLNNDGKITVTAPEFFTQRDVYKDVIKPQLEQISVNYKINPDYKYASSSDDNESYTAEEYIKRLNDDFNSSEVIKQFQEIGKETDTMRERGFSDWTDAESEISLYGNNDLVENPKDDSRVYVADFSDVNFFENAVSYDKDTGTISYADFRDIFSRKKNSDEDVLEKYARMKQVDAEAGLGPNSGMSASQYARSKAAYRLAQNTSPEVGIVEGIIDHLSGFAMGIMNSVETSTFGFAADLGISAFPVGFPAIAQKLYRSAGAFGIDTSNAPEMLDIAMTPETVSIHNTWEEAYSQDTEKREILNDSSIATRTVADVGGNLIQLAGVGAVAKGARTAFKASKVAKVAEAEQVAQKAMTGLKRGGALVSLTKKISGLTVEDVMQGTKISLEAAKAADVSQSTLQAIRTYNEAQRILRTTKGLSAAAKLAFNSTSFVAESFISTVIIEPDLLKKAVEGDKTGEVSKELWTQLAVDTAVVGGIKGASTAIKGLSKTTIGSAVNVNAAMRMAKLETKLTDIKNGMLGVITKNKDQAERAVKLIVEGDSANKVRKGVTIGLNEVITRAKKDFASSDRVKWIGQDFEKVRADVKAAELRKINTVEKAQIAVDRYQRSIDAEIRAAINSSSQTKKAYDELMMGYSKLVKMDKAMGKSIGKAMTPSGQMRLLSQDTANYLGAKYNIAYYTRKPEVTGTPLTKQEEESLADARQQVEEFQEKTKNNPQLLAAADDFYAKQQTVYKELSSYFAEKGVFSESDIASKRASGLWGPEGDEYIRQQRVKKTRGQFTSSTKDIRGKLDTIKAGKGDFADPAVVFSDWIARNSDKLNRQNVLRMLKGDEYEVLASGTETMIARDASAAAQKRFNKEVEASVKSFIDSTTKKNVFKLEFNARVGKSAMLKQEDEVNKAVSRAAKARIANPRVTRAERSIYIAEMSDEQLESVAGSLLGYTRPSEYMADLVGGGYVAEGVEGIGYTSDEVFAYWLSSLDKKDVDTIRRSITAYLETEGRTIEGDVLTYENYMRLANQDQLFERTIMADILGNNSKYRDSEAVKDIIREEKVTHDVFMVNEACKKEVETLQKIMDKHGISGFGYREGEVYESISKIINDELDDVVDAILKTDNGKVADAILKAGGGDGDVERQYIAFRALMEHRADFLKSIKEQAKKEIKTLSGKGANITEAEQNAFANSIGDVAENELFDRFNALHQKLVEIKSPIADQKYVFEEVQKIRKKVNKAEARMSEADSGVVPLGTKDGELEYIEVDPLIATLVQSNNAYARNHMNGFANLLYAQSKLFRLGTTGLRLKSWLMQTSRDSIALYSGVGMLRTTGNCADELAEVLGPDLIREFKAFDEKTYQRIVDNIMEENTKLTREGAEEVANTEISRELAQQIANRELTMGYNRASTATQTEAYRQKRATGVTLRGQEIDQTKLDAFSNAIDYVMRAKFIGKTKIPNPLHLNEFREDYMRRLAYSNTFNQSIKAGYGVESSRIHAEFIMNNATTNFSRMPVHFQSLQNTVPYLGSAINGTKSFYRMLSLDPVGVMGRLVGGIMVPALALTCFSLSTEENRKIYKNIPEYAKEDSLVFVADGQVISIPIPQEMSSIFGPLRHFVENLYDVSNHEYWELAANTILGISPIDLTGFLALDSERLSGDPTFTERFSTGFSKMVAQLTPPMVKSMIMVTTGKDPYTGKDIDSSYVYRDPETGEKVVMDYKTGSFAKWCANLFGEETNAYIFETVFSNLLGNTGVNFLDDITSWAQAVPAANILTEAAGAYNVEVYDRANTAWREAYKELQREKDAITNSKDYKAIQDQISRASGDAQKKLLEDLNDMLTPFYEHSKTVVNNLIDQYSAQYTRSKFAATLSLLNFGTDVELPGLTQRARDISSEEFLAGRNQAVETMWKLGFKSTNDTSIFGYIKKNTDGEYEIVYNSPLSILALENAQLSQSAIHESNLGALLDQNDIISISSASYNDPEYKKAQDAGGDTWKQYKANWNERTAKALAPYIQKYGVENVIKGGLVDYLYDYIFVKNLYKTKDYLIEIFKED